MIVVKYLLWLILYSFAGWVYETVLCSIQEKKFVNRGFLNGPYCPIYGFGAILDILLIGWIDNIFLLFFIGMLVTGVLEYFTSWLLEVLFHAKWWDYSYMRFHINGRVSLIGALAFGFMSVVLIRFIHPFVVARTDAFPKSLLLPVTVILSIAVLIDLVYTLVHFGGFQKKLKQIHAFIDSNLKPPEVFGKVLLQIEDNPLVAQILEKLKGLALKMDYQEKRILQAFPRFRSLRYNEVLDKIKDYMKQQSSERKSNRREK